MVSFPKLNLFFCAFFFLVPLLVILDKKKVKGAFWPFFISGLVSNVLVLYWIPGIMIKHGGVPRVLSYLGLLLLAALFALFSGLAGILVKESLATGMKALVLIPLVWVSRDLVVEHFISGFPWCLTGYSQYKNLLFIQWAEFGGVHLVTALVVFFNVLIFLLIRDRNKRLVFALAVAVTGIYSTGYFLLKLEAGRHGDRPVHRAGIIQPNTPNAYIFGREKQLRLDRLFADSRELTARGAGFVIWPEYTVPVLPLQSPYILEQFMTFAKNHAPLVAGFNDLVSSKEFYNTTFLFKPGKVEKYYKVHLTPFGEYVPFRNLLFFVKNITNEIGDYTFGPRVHNLELGGHALATPICYEMIFPELVRSFIAKGGEVIVSISNDSWVGDTSSPRQIFSMGLFRAVENRRYILRSTSTGISALIAPTGKILKSSPWAEKDQFIAEFKYLDRKTLFTRFGYLFPYLCAFLTLLYFLLLPLIRKIKK